MQTVRCHAAAAAAADAQRTELVISAASAYAERAGVQPRSFPLLEKLRKVFAPVYE